mmetsp:Transcript_16735/g.18862  ORF Transcript_16735/g.18862 Transcript_16735/m.18862 type:complete len:96 (+) Transcript_16735:306-593(+)
MNNVVMFSICSQWSFDVELEFVCFVGRGQNNLIRVQFDFRQGTTTCVLSNRFYSSMKLIRFDEVHCFSLVIHSFFPSCMCRIKSKFERKQLKFNI